MTAAYHNLACLSWLFDGIEIISTEKTHCTVQDLVSMKCLIST